MRIKIELNQKSINDAIKQLEKAKKQFSGVMLDEFYKECYKFFVEMANFYLVGSGIGDLVIAEIQSSWNYVPITTPYKGVRFVNTADKAVFVEFGVGVVGESNKHPNAVATAYEYNKPSNKKIIDGSWVFKSYEEELDIPKEAIISHNYDVEGKMRILTRGTKGCFYAFNALEDLRREIPSIWKKIKIKYWS